MSTTPAPYTRVRLANGLDVVVLAQRAAPLAAVYLWVDAGTAHETKGLEGAAHLLEHMLFKGTPTRGVGQLAAAIEDLGGDLNAYTTTDHTVLHATVPAPGVNTAIDVLADMALHSALDADEFTKEKVVVCEEIRGYADDPSSVLFDVVVAALHKDHPYGKPVLGTVDSVTAISRDALHAFWKRTWQPGAATLAICGDVDVDAVIAEATARFGGWPSGPVVPPPPPPPGPYEGSTKLVASPSQQPQVHLSFPTPAWGHADCAPLEVLTEALADVSSALLVERLQHQLELVASVSASLATERGTGWLSIEITPVSGKTLAAVRETMAVLDELRREGVSEATARRARVSALSSLLFVSETVDGSAHDLAFYTRRTHNPEGALAWRASLAAVDAARIQQVARDWLHPERAVLSVIDPTLREPALHKALHARPRPAEHYKPGPDGVYRVQTPQGATLIVRPDAAPIVAMQASSISGRLVVPAARAGIGLAWSEAIEQGAGRWPNMAFSEALDDLGASFTGRSGACIATLQASAPAEALGGTLDLLISALTDPHLDEDELERTKTELLDDLSHQSEHAEDIAALALNEALYPGHPYSVPFSGTPATIKSLRDTHLRTLHEQSFRADNTVLAITGGMNANRAIAQALDMLSDLPKRKAKPLPPPPGPMRAGEQVVYAGHEQALVHLACRAPSATDHRRYAIRLAVSALSAQSGRLFLALREQRSLAYSVWCESEELHSAGAFVAGLAADPSRAEEAKQVLQQTVFDFASSGPNTAELDRARALLLGASAMGVQRASGRAARLVNAQLFGLPHDLSVSRAALLAVTADEVRDALSECLAEGYCALTVLPMAR